MIEDIMKKQQALLQESVDLRIQQFLEPILGRMDQLECTLKNQNLENQKAQKISLEKTLQSTLDRVATDLRTKLMRQRSIGIQEVQKNICSEVQKILERCQSEIDKLEKQQTNMMDQYQSLQNQSIEENRNAFYGLEKSLLQFITTSIKKNKSATISAILLIIFTFSLLTFSAIAAHQSFLKTAVVNQIQSEFSELNTQVFKIEENLAHLNAWSVTPIGDVIQIKTPHETIYFPTQNGILVDQNGWVEIFHPQKKE